jgi:hypothetical protein
LTGTAGGIQRGVDRDFIADRADGDVDDAATATDDGVDAAGCFDADPASAVPAVNLAVVSVQCDLTDERTASRQCGYKVNG